MSKHMKAALVVACEDQLNLLKKFGIATQTNLTAELLAYSYFRSAKKSGKAQR